MAVTDLHTIGVSEPLDRLFTNGSTFPGAVLSLVPETPTINVGENRPIVMGKRAKGALLGEGDKKPDNGRTPKPLPFVTKKIVYSQRVSDEFLQWAEAKQADFVSRLVNDWLTSSFPRDIDTIFIHGIDPHTGSVAETLSTYLTKRGVSTKIGIEGDTAADIDGGLAKAIETLSGKGQGINGIAYSTDAGTKLATITTKAGPKYPDLGTFGIGSTSLGGIKAASTPEVGEHNDVKLVLGDWGQLLFGFAGDATWKTIEFGNPDGSEAGDLQQLNQVCIRLELFFGFQVLDSDAFAYVAKSVES